MFFIHTGARIYLKLLCAQLTAWLPTTVGKVAIVRGCIARSSAILLLEIPEVFEGSLLMGQVAHRWIICVAKDDNRIILGRLALLLPHLLGTYLRVPRSS